MPIRPFPAISLDFLLETRDHQRKLLSRRTRLSRSYVRAFVDCLAAQMSQASVTLVPDTGNTNRTLTVASGVLCLASNDQATYGPVLGTGTNAVNILDYKLQTQIAHGSGAGQLDYQATEMINLQTVGSTRSFKLRRLFVNGSGGAIVVNECGIYFTFSAWFFCAIRDLVSPGVSIPNGGTGTLIYTIGATV